MTIFFIVTTVLATAYAVGWYFEAKLQQRRGTACMEVSDALRACVGGLTAERDDACRQLAELTLQREPLERELRTWKHLHDQMADLLHVQKQAHQTLLTDLDKVLMEKIQEHGKSSLLLPALPAPKVHATKKQMKELVKAAVKGRILTEVRIAMLRSVGPDDTIDGRLIPNEIDLDGSIAWFENLDAATGGIYGLPRA
jgi:hypothetical protein